MLSLLFALSASAQPSAYGGNGPFYGAGTPVPYYAAARPVAPVFPVYASQPVASPVYVAPPVYAGRPIAPVYAGRQSIAPVYTGPVRAPNFELSQANRLVRASELDYRGNNLFYNTPWDELFPNAVVGGEFNGFLNFGNVARAKSAQMDEDRLQDEIDRFRATHRTLTREDQNYLDDLVLQRESARNQKLRRTVSVLPNNYIQSNDAPYAAFFERRANDNDYSLAKNALKDAREEYQKEQTQENLIAVRNAEDDVEQADQRRDANTYDLMGTNLNFARRLGPIFRKKASQTKLDIGNRNFRLARSEYEKDPSEDNRLKLQLADLFVRATEEEDEANKAEITYGTFIPTWQGMVMGHIANSKNFQDESRLWLRYDRLKRQILLREQAKALEDKGASPVAQQLLGLSMYGPAAAKASNGASN